MSLRHPRGSMQSNLDFTRVPRPNQGTSEFRLHESPTSHEAMVVVRTSDVKLDRNLSDDPKSTRDSPSHVE